VSFPTGIEVALEFDIELELEPDLVLIVFELVPELVIALD
jgi:hypothetical protein